MSAEVIDLPIVEVPQEHQRMVEMLLEIGGDEIRGAYDQRPDGAHVVVVAVVDDHRRPTQIKDTDLIYVTTAEIAQHDPDASEVERLVSALNIAAAAGVRAVIMVIQDDQGQAVAVHSVEPSAGPSLRREGSYVD